MSRSRVTFLLLSAPLALILFAGCAHHASPALTPAAPAIAVAAVPPAAPGTPAPPADFQPYTLLPPPTAPPVVTPRHRVLHAIRVRDRVYLKDADRRLYEAGRDTHGHVYPVYRDPVTRAAYPLYYDPARDNLYRVARTDDGRFYRNYVGQPSRQFYAADRDYERVPSSDDDRPIVTDSYNTYNYNTYNTYGNGSSPYGPSRPYGNPRPFYGADRPAPVHHSSHHNSDWLWAIPVIVGAYFLLQPHHHHSSPPPNRAARPTVIVRQTTPVTIVNNNAPVYNGRPSYAAVYVPPPPPRARTISSRGPVTPHRLPSPSALPAARPVRPLPPRVLTFRRPVTSTPAFFRRPRLFPARRVLAVVTARPPRSAPKPVAHAPEAPRTVVRLAPRRPQPIPVHLVRPEAEEHRAAPRPFVPAAHPVVINPIRHQTPRVEPAAAARPAPAPKRISASPHRETVKPRREEVKSSRPQTARPREERGGVEKTAPKKNDKKQEGASRPARR